MAKNMARIENGVVVNIQWHADQEPETEVLVDTADRPVGIGDTYASGKFCRNGVELLTPLEAALAEVEALRKRIEELDGAYAEGVNSV